MLDFNTLKFRIRLYIQFRKKATSRKGHGIHSPFMFQFVRSCLAPKPNKTYVQIEDEIQQEIKNFPVLPSGIDAGAGQNTGKPIKPVFFYQNSSVRGKWGMLLYRIVQEYRPKNILELGTGIGVSACIMHKANAQAHITSLEGNETMAKHARMLWQKTGSSINLIEGTFQHSLPAVLPQMKAIDLIYIDGNHRKQPTYEYIQQILPYTHNRSIWILDDINWSEEMQELWNQVIKMPQFTASVNLYRMGILFMQKELYKQDFTINY